MSFECWIFSHGSDLIASQLLLEIAHWIPLSPQSVSSHLISTHLISRPVIFFLPHLISSHLMSSLPCSVLLSWSQLLSSLLMSPELFSSILISSQLISAFLNFSQIFTTLLSSPQLMSAHLVSSHLFSPILTLSKLFSHLLSWSQFLSARLTSSQSFSAHSQIISALLWPKTCSKQGSWCQSKRPLRFPQRRFNTENLYTLYAQQASVQRSLYTQKLFHRNRETFAQGQGSFCSLKAFTQSKSFTFQADEKLAPKLGYSKYEACRSGRIQNPFMPICNFWDWT